MDRNAESSLMPTCKEYTPA